MHRYRVIFATLMIVMILSLIACGEEDEPTVDGDGELVVTFDDGDIRIGNPDGDTSEADADPLPPLDDGPISCMPVCHVYCERTGACDSDYSEQDVASCKNACEQAQESASIATNLIACAYESDCDKFTACTDNHGDASFQCIWADTGDGDIDPEVTAEVALCQTFCDRQFECDPSGQSTEDNRTSCRQSCVNDPDTDDPRQICADAPDCTAFHACIDEVENG